MLFGKNCNNAFYFYKVIRENIVPVFAVSFPEAVRDNVVSNEVTITSSLRSDVIILGINFLFSCGFPCPNVVCSLLCCKQPLLLFMP